MGDGTLRAENIDLKGEVMGKKLCYGKAKEDAKQRNWNKQSAYDDPNWERKHPCDYAQQLPSGLKRMRLTCDTCRRKIVSSIKICEDGCCVNHVIPPHKPKGWWKRKKVMQKKKRKGKNRQRKIVR